MRSGLFTSESVSEGHPDKVADQISDSILDACLEQDTESRVACETMISTGFVMVSGEITSKSKFNVENLVRKQVQKIGYDGGYKGFDYKTCLVMTAIGQQSQDIAKGVSQSESIGAGDQGLMFGYATNETKELMPLSIQLSHDLMKELSYKRRSKENWFLGPDSKSQVTVEYEDYKIKRIHTIVVSTQHSPEKPLEEVRSF